MRKNPMLTCAIVAGLSLLTLAFVFSPRHSGAPAKSDLEHYFWVVSHAESPAQDRYQAFLKLVAATNSEWRAAHLRDLNLENAWLPDTDLHGADFTDVSFSHATLSRAKLSSASLQRTDLSAVDLSQ